MIGILAEKPSALRNMAKALGDVQGTYNGEQYLIVAARGHLYALDDPENQVDKPLADRYKSWDISNLPWSEKDFHWKYRPAKDSKDTLATIKSSLSICDEVCIATDDDPTGEGELLAWEILDQLNISPKKWSRMYFVDESQKELQKAFVNRKPIQSMQTDPDYIKAFYRSRWDFMSMQFTRLATKLGDGHSVLRQGRLKSAMVLLVGDALKALDEYQEIPYYQNRFKDENGVIYTNPDEQCYEKKEDVPQIYKDSDVVKDSATMKSTAPPKMLDLATLSSRLAGKGYKAKTVTETYQKMYEAQVVSYPRTEDKVITPEQFNDLLPLVDQIATVVGVDTSLLTHRTPRATHVKKGGSHGANRPGPSVPASLASLSKFDGKSSAGCAAAIYELLAKNYLATLAEDYEYESQKGHIKDYPKFVGTAAIPKKMGWKAVYDADTDPDPDENKQGLGTHADPYVHEGFPPKPPTPTMKWLMKQLEKRDVGTGATRTSTYAEVTREKSETNLYPLLIDKKGKISMTQYGQMSYMMLPGTNIGSLDVTERLMTEMREIATGSKDPEVCLHDIQRMVMEDLEIMRKNGEIMRQTLKVGGGEKISGVWNGKEISFKKEWSGHTFTDDECEALLRGEEIIIEAVNKEGKPFKCAGSLEEQDFKGRKFVGFKMSRLEGNSAMPDSERYSGVWNGKEIKFKRNWSGHYFTDEECEALLRGEDVSFEATSSKGNPYTAIGKLAEQEYAGHRYVGFKLNPRENSSGGSNTPNIPDTYCRHKFTDEEKESLLAGLPIEASDFYSEKKQKTFSAKLKYGVKDDGKYGFTFMFG